MSEEKNKLPNEEGKNDLYIGVRNDLSPFCVDLEALTRGLVVIGQSGCGKSFLVGRLVEELVQKTTEMTRLLIIDSNSDFCYGMSLEEERQFIRTVAKYCSGLLKKKEFLDFKRRELESYRILKSQNQLKCQLIGREKPFDLSWEWLVKDPTRYLKILKADRFSGTYGWAFTFMLGIIKGDLIAKPERWLDAITEISSLRQGNEVGYEFIDHIIDADILKTIDDVTFTEIISDLLFELIGGSVWSGGDHDNSLPQLLFKDERVNFVEVEMIHHKKSRLETVAFILLYCLSEHAELIEQYRNSRNEGDDQKLKEAKSKLKHTFILIDEAQNYAPEETSDPHEKMLGELIHTIAAEGRKYGLHVILATQRPNKIKRGLLGECDNAIIMKMNSRSDLEHLAREMRILDVKLLEPCLHFQGQGNALAVGEMTRMAPYVQLFKSAPRRTREGGVDIKEY